MAAYDNNKYPKPIKDFIVFNGDTLPEFYQPAPHGRGAEFYVKFYTYLFDYYLTNDAEQKPFFASRKGILKIFNKRKVYDEYERVVRIEGYGNSYCEKTLDRALNKLLRLHLIYYREANKDDEIPFRKIYVDMDKAKELFNVYEPVQDRFIKEYAMKLAVDEVDANEGLSEEEKGVKLNDLYKMFVKQLKKIAQKRPYNYTEKAEEKYQEYKEEGIHKGKYNSASEMISYYQYHIAQKYARKTVFTKYIPSHLKNQQEELNNTLQKKAIPGGKLTIEDIGHVKALGAVAAKVYVESKLIGYTVEASLVPVAIENYLVLGKGNKIVAGYEFDADRDKNRAMLKGFMNKIK